MDIVYYALLFIFWTMFWSFSSVLIYRIKLNEPWIMNWRSHCAKCMKNLEFIDLFPIFSWLLNAWKCRYCKEKISPIYPILEITTWALFLMIWIFLVDFQSILWGDIIEITKLIFFLIITLFSVVYVFYDILFLEIPEVILLIWIILTTIILSLQTLFSNFHIIENIPAWTSDIQISIYAIMLSIGILISLYTIMLKWLHELYDITIIFLIIISLYTFKNIFDVNLTDFAILNAICWALWIFLFFFLQILVSKWEWMWWWDLRIALLIWLILWTSLSFIWTMITYLAWSIIWIIILLKWKWKYKSIKHKLDTQIPFWPFLAVWFFVSIFFSEYINNLIEKYFINM